MPTGLADGLGLGSDLGTGYPVPCAPSPTCVGELGSPAPACRKANRLRLLQTAFESHRLAGLSTSRGITPLTLELGEAHLAGPAKRHQLIRREQLLGKNVVSARMSALPKGR